MQTIITHSGNYHPDDVFAVATLQLLLGEENTEIIRSRDEAIIATGDYVVDVGEVYDAETKRFDHHQNGVPDRDSGLPYAAFGLVWKHYGVELTGSEEIVKSIDERLVQPIDAGDNGIRLYELNDRRIAPYELFSVLGTFKPVAGSDGSYDDAFQEAVDFARGLLTRVIAHEKAAAGQQALARQYYEAATDKSIVVLDKIVDRHYFTQFEEVKVVIYPERANPNSDRWKAAVVPTGKKAFDDRVSFPKEWGGLRDEELTNVSGIKAAVFCHKGLYLFVAESKESAIEAAKQAR